jgi:hypothetical protein
METLLLAFWLVVYLLLWFLRSRPKSTFAHFAFAWIGPRPVVGQAWSAYQASWAMYSFAWLCQIALVFSALYFLGSRFASISSHAWFLAVSFGLTLGAGMALLAAIGFLCKAGKARYLGPDPICRPTPADGTAWT